MEVFGISVGFHAVGAFLRLSLVVFNFRLTISLRRPGAPFTSFPGIDLEPNKVDSSEPEDLPPPMNSLLTDHAQQREWISHWERSRRVYRKPSGDVS